VSTIVEWLVSLGMAEYTERFAENGIDIDVLSELTDQDLEKLGVLLGHRRRILKAIRELGQPRLAAAASAAPQDSAERRQLTVVFCDLVGSTAISAKLDPEDLSAVMGAYHRCWSELIARNGGFVAPKGLVAALAKQSARQEETGKRGARPTSAGPLEKSR
jgi:class 3 adenylate cyclase